MRWQVQLYRGWRRPCFAVQTRTPTMGAVTVLRAQHIPHDFSTIRPRLRDCTRPAPSACVIGAFTFLGMHACLARKGPCVTGVALRPALAGVTGGSQPKPLPTAAAPARRPARAGRHSSPAHPTSRALRLLRRRFSAPSAPTYLWRRQRGLATVATVTPLPAARATARAPAAQVTAMPAKGRQWRQHDAHARPSLCAGIEGGYRLAGGGAYEVACVPVACTSLAAL